jgi:hypothetical protein
VARLVRRSLEQGRTVKIERLGVFRPGKSGAYRFVPARAPSVFLSYVQEDRPQVQKIYARLHQNGYDPWMDCHNLLPGQNWARAIERAIEVSEFFLPVLSPRSVNKRGTFQSELRWALDCARRLPLDDVFVIPVRLEECAVPRRIQQDIQYVDLFPDLDAGLRRVETVIEEQWSGRRAA